MVAPDDVPTTVDDVAISADSVSAAYRHHFGDAPVGVWAAPGRVNLIGEHTDYNDGFVMPFALAQSVLVAASRRDDDRLVIASSDHGAEEVALADLDPARAGWYAYVEGVAWALQQAGHRIGGANLWIESEVPVGSGLSSSAAIECATLTALIDLYEISLEPLDRARAARSAENDYVGAPTGIMDQSASLMCRADHALFLDCRSLATEHVSFDPAAAGLELVVLDTCSPHALVDSEYAARRESCERAASLLGVPALRDIRAVDDSVMATITDAEMLARVRHVVTENERVLRAADLLRAGRVADIGGLMDASHASMRDDFEITVPTVDLAVDTAKQFGALGARMTGGGFGGCIIALCATGEGRRITDAIAVAFADAGFNTPRPVPAAPSDGARRLR